MDVLGHNIDETEIIGIGPLQAKFHPDQAMRSLYNSFQYRFELHCRQQSIEIKSDFWMEGSFTEEARNDLEKQRRKDYHDKYYLIQDEIRKMIEARRGDALESRVSAIEGFLNFP